MCSVWIPWIGVALPNLCSATSPGARSESRSPRPSRSGGSRRLSARGGGAVARPRAEISRVPSSRASPRRRHGRASAACRRARSHPSRLGSTMEVRRGSGGRACGGGGRVDRRPRGSWTPASRVAAAPCRDSAPRSGTGCVSGTTIGSRGADRSDRRCGHDRLDPMVGGSRPRFQSPPCRSSNIGRQSD